MSRAALFAVLLAVSCATVDRLDPVQKPTADYPCTPSGVVCVVQKMCCPPGNTCGGEPGSVGCAQGDCCYIGTDVDEPEVRARRTTKQTPQR